MIYKCINTEKINRNTLYTLETEDNNIIQVNSDELKALFGDDMNEFTNIKIDKLGRITRKHKSHIGEIHGDFKVIEDITGDKVLVKCIKCGYTKYGYSQFLNNKKGITCTNCGVKKNTIDLTDQTFGEWKVLYYSGNKMWHCRCSCGVEKDINGQTLREGLSKSCGHSTSKLRDIEGQTFGKWRVLEKRSNGYWLCECSCQNKTQRLIYGGSLRCGRTTSCGCDKNTKRKHTLMQRYGEVSTIKINNPRENWQIEVINNKDKFTEYLKNNKLSISELAKQLNVGYSAVQVLVHKYNLESYVNLWDFSSQYENEIKNYIKSIYSSTVEYNIRSVIPPYELDIYIPDKKLAIEFNGNYWHSSCNKDKNYHLNKTIKCIQSGIRLIHIFEYEWVNESTKSKIKNLLHDSICGCNVLMARKCDIKEISGSEAEKFETDYHINGAVNASINFGMYYNNELIGIVTFGKPRFNSEYQYELIRLCWRPGIIVVGGFEKFMAAFTNKYKPISLISYVNASKFYGTSYKRLGFKYDGWTEPNYVWVNSNNDVISRYKAQKQNLVKQGYSPDMTEEEIMSSLGYIKVYDSGNLRYIEIFNSK